MTAVRACVLLVVLFPALTVTAAAQEAAAKPKSLYERLGGYDVIAKIVDDFGPKLGKDPKIAPLVASLAMTSRKRNRQLIVDQLCELTGGPCFYIGRSMQAAHQGLGITEDHWKQAGKLMGETLDTLKIGEPEKSEFIAVIEKLRPDILEQKKDQPATSPPTVPSQQR